LADAFPVGSGVGEFVFFEFLFQFLIAFGVRWDFCAKIE
jgi:hypothetical protein